MKEIIVVKFKKSGKLYYFDPIGIVIKKGQFVVVETARGVEIGEVTSGNQLVSEESIVAPLKPVLRVATDEDLEKVKTNEKKEKDAFKVCLEKIEARKLDMKLVDVEYTFDQSKVLFYFTSDGRVDFRELVKDLASVLRVRIELRQIGVRDEAKMIGGLGICGRKLCCSSHLGNFEPVSIKMAKEQNLSLNPTKISGVCSRLMCCLKYEQNAYDDLLKTTPALGSFVKTPEGNGVVSEVNLLKGLLKVTIGKDDDKTIKSFHVSDIDVLKSAEIKVDDAELKALKNLE